MRKQPKLMPALREAIMAAALMSGALFAGPALGKTPLELVDPRIGSAHSRWFFFTPGAMPFGMAKPGPCTDAHYGNVHGWDTVGYDARQGSIESFVSFREFQVGGVAVMATTGNLKTTPGDLKGTNAGYRSHFDKQDEVAQPGYYSVLLKDYGIQAELTATPRVAFHRFTFPATTDANVLFDVGNRQGESGAVLDAFARRVNDRELEGFVCTQPEYVKAYQPGAAVKMYFVARFDKTPAAFGTFAGAAIRPGEDAVQGPGCGCYLKFHTAERETVTVTMGMSYTSIGNARLNLEGEAQKLGFDQARQAAQRKWAEMLGRIQVSGGKELDQVKFYTGLYHALLGRGLCSDVNGAYPRNDGGIGQIPRGADGAPEYNHYNTDAIWGGYWNLTPLWALAYPDYFSDYVRCQLDIYRDCGWLPDGVAAGKFVSGVGTDFMGVVVSSAYEFGIRDYDVAQAYAAVRNNELGWQNRPVGVGKADVKSFLDHGYVPLLRQVSAFSGSTADGSLFAASHTLEYSFSAFAGAQFARALGKTNDCALLTRYARGWENLYDEGTNFIRPKDASGKFVPDFDPVKPWNGFQEGNAWQYTFFVPHDPARLIRKMGLEVFRARLATMFEQSERSEFGGSENEDAFAGLGSLYNQGDQPSLEIAWLFNYCGQPWLTQHWTRRICDVFYGSDPVHGYGFGQDEDQGQLGAWYVLAGLGLFDVQGGTAAEPTLQLATPLFARVHLQLQSRYYPGGHFDIEVDGNPPQDCYIQSASWNNEPLDRCWICWKDVVTHGGTLKLITGTAPNKNWAVQQPPPSMSQP